MTTITIPNFKGTQAATFKVLGQYNKKLSLIKEPVFMCENNLDGQWYKVFGLGTTEITISKIGCIGLIKTSNFFTN